MGGLPVSLVDVAFTIAFHDPSMAAFAGSVSATVDLTRLVASGQLPADFNGKQGAAQAGGGGGTTLGPDT